MYTMKIVLFSILLICVISKVFATWSTRSLAKRIDSMKEKLSQEEAKQDILSLLNIDNEDGSKSVTLQNFPLKKLLKADFSQAPMFEKAKKIKSKPKETLDVVPLENPENFYSEFNSKYPTQYLTPSQFHDDSESGEIIPNNKHVNSDASETDEMLFVIRLPPTYSYIKGQPLQNKPYKANIPPIVDGLSVEDMTVLEIPPESSKESKNYYFEPDNKPQINYYQNQHADGHYYKPKHSTFNKKLMQLIKRLMFKSKLKREMNRSKNFYRVGDNVMGRFTKAIKHNSMPYYDKLKEYLQELVAKLLNKAMTQREDQEKVRRNYNGHRFKRDTQAGYTQDPDTCKKYNENLEKMWDTLSNYLNSTDTVNQQALHNIAVMVEAYIAHQNERPHLEEVDYHQEKKKDKISEFLTKTKKLLGDENATEKIKEMVLQNFKPEYDDNTECKQTNEDNLLSSIDLSYKNYLENAKCRGDYDTGLLRGKALLRNGAPFKPKDMSGRPFYDTYVVHKSVLDDAEASEEFHKGRILANKQYKKRGRFNRWNKRRSFGRSTKLSRYARQFKKRQTGLRRRPKKSLKKKPKKTHIRSDEACVKYANRKFLITLRTSIERFMDLRDCHQDDTLRTSNKNRKAINRRRKQALRTSNKRKFNDMTFYTDTELGEKEQRRINNYLGNIKNFKDQEINRNKSIFIVHTTSYKSPLLLKLNNKREGMHGYTSNMKRPFERPSYYNKQSKNSFDTIYKSFLESSDKYSFDTLHSKRHRESGIRDINLYDIIKQKVDQEKNKPLFGTVGRQNDEDSIPLDVEPILYNNSSDDATPTNTSDTNLVQNGTSINFQEIGSMLDEVRNSTLQKPQIDASNFVSNNDKGYVELSYLVKYPKSIVFRPQYLVKNILQYEEFVKVASQLYVTDEGKQLMKIVRYLPDNKTQILFETQDFKSPIEVFDVKEAIKKTKPIFSTNFSDSNEALRQRTTNETDIYNFENENETQINVLPEDRINVDSPLRENDHVNSLYVDNESSGLIIADAFTEDTINTDISNIEPLREDNISADITRTETLTEDEIHTDLTNEKSQREISSSTDVSLLFRNHIITNDNDREETEDSIKTEIKNINLLRDSKISVKVENFQEDNIATDTNRAETLPEEKNDTQIISTDSLQESNINAYVSVTDILRNDNINIDDDQIDHLSDDLTNRELNSVDSLRETKIGADTDKALGSDSLQKDEDRTSTEQNIALLQETKNNYDDNYTALLRKNNISTLVTRTDLVQEDKITTEDSQEYLQSDDKMSTVLNEIDLLRQKKINPNAYHVGLLQENTKLNKDDPTDNNERHLPEGSFNMDRIDYLLQDKIITNDNPLDFLLETNTEENNAVLLRVSNNDIDVDRAYPVSENNINVEDVSAHFLEDNTEVNYVYSLRESGNSSEVNRETSQLEDNNDTEIAHVALRDNKIITEQEDKNSTEDNEHPPNETKIGLYLNIQPYSSEKDSAVSHGGFMSENNINVDDNRVDLQREEIGSTDGNFAESLLENTENTDPRSLRDSKIRSNSKKVDVMQYDDISLHSLELLPGDKTSTEENMTQSLQQIKINHDVDFADFLREHNNTTEANSQDRLKENKTNAEVDNTDYLTENKIIVSEYSRGQKETIEAEVDREHPITETIDDPDSLQAITINPYISNEDSLLNDGIFMENNNADPPLKYQIQTKIYHVDSLRENQISPYINNQNYLRKDLIITEDNSADPSKIQTQINHLNSLLENQISSYIKHTNSSQKDIIITEDNSAAQGEIQIDNADSLRENNISTYVKQEDSLLKYSTISEISNADFVSEHDNISTDNVSGATLAENINHSNFNNGDTLRESIISRDVKQKIDLQEENFGLKVKRGYPLAEIKTIEVDKVNYLRESAITTDANDANLLSGDKITTDSNRDDSLLENSQSNEFNYGNEYPPLGGAGQLRNNKTGAEVDPVDNLQDENIISDVSRIDSKDTISTEVNKTDFLKEVNINPGDNQVNRLREGTTSTEAYSSDSLLEDISPKLSNPLREHDTHHDIHRDNPLLEDKHSEVNSYKYNQPEEVDHLQNSKIDTDVKETRPLREDNMKPEVNPVDLPKDKISIEVSQENINNDGNSSLRKGKTSNELNRADLLPVDEIDALFSQVDQLQDKISSEINYEDTLREEISSTVVNRAKLFPDEIMNTNLSHNIPSYEAKIASVVTRSDSLRAGDVSFDDIRSDTLSKYIGTPEYNNKNILRVGNISTEVNPEDSLRKDKVDTEMSNKNLMQEYKLSSVINNGDRLPEDILKKILRDDKINLNVTQDKIDVKDKTAIDVSNLLPERKDKANTELKYENPLHIGNASKEIGPLTALRDKAGVNVPDHSEGKEVSTDDYRVNPLLKDIINHEIDNSDSSHVDLLSDDNINKDIIRVDTLPSEENKLNTNRVDTIQEDTTTTEVNTKSSLRESNIDSNVKLTKDLPEDEPNSDLNRDTLQEDTMSTSITRSDPLPEDKIETDDLNLDPLKEPRNYTEELDYLTYQDGFIAGLNTSSNEFKRGENSVELPNPVLNETSYKYNSSSALREQVINAFNDTLNSSEFINRKDDTDLNELNKNISLPDIDAESIADYLKFTLNNAEASLSTASQAYLKELETQGLTNAATTKVLLKNWWDAWKNKLTAKVQSIAGRVTNILKKLDNTSLSNEEPEIK